MYCHLLIVKHVRQSEREGFDRLIRRFNTVLFDVGNHVLDTLARTKRLKPGLNQPNNAKYRAYDADGLPCRLGYAECIVKVGCGKNEYQCY